MDQQRQCMKWNDAVRMSASQDGIEWICTSKSAVSKSLKESQRESSQAKSKGPNKKTKVQTNERLKL